MLRSVLFAIVFNSISVIAVLLAIPAALLGSESLQHHVSRWARFHHWCNKAILGIDRRIEGEVPREPCLVAAKHQAMYETLELILILDRPAIIFKKELADLPVWGWVARKYGTIPVDRGGSAKALLSVVRLASAEVKKGRPIVIFPEGTRVRPGEMPTLRAGFAGLYKALGLPVVPVAVDSGHFWLRGHFLKRRGVITFRFGAPIPPGLPRAQIEALVHQAINALEEVE